MKNEKEKTSTNGFTLLELLVVILIIGILAAVALPQYKKAVLKAKFARLQPAVNSLYDAAVRFYLVNNYFTDEIELLDIDFNAKRFSKPSNGKNRISYTMPNKSVCTLNNNGQSINCATENRKMFYLAVPPQSDVYVSQAGKKFCCACSYDTTEEYNKFCQNLTGKNDPFFQGRTMLDNETSQFLCETSCYQI